MNKVQRKMWKVLENQTKKFWSFEDGAEVISELDDQQRMVMKIKHTIDDFGQPLEESKINEWLFMPTCGEWFYGDVQEIGID